MTPPTAEEIASLCALLVAASRPENPVTESVHQAFHRRSAKCLRAAAADRQRLAERLREAERLLRFYGEETNYRSPSRGFALQYEPEAPPVMRDAGKDARQFLAGEGEGSKP